MCHSAAALGVTARAVEVEVDVRPGNPAVVFVGLPDVAVREARDRVKAAIQNTGYSFPPNRVVVNLAPADLRKEGSAFDLPIAVAILAASGQVEVPRARDHLLYGELGLDGRLRPVRGALCVADRGARGSRWKGLLVPPENAGEAALARGIPVRAPATLEDAVAYLSGRDSLPAVDPPAPDPGGDGGGGEAAPDFSQVRGQEGAVRAALLAAAGGHNLLLLGPPGSGKTMVAERLPGLLPPLDDAGRIEATKVHSVAGTLRGACVARPPFRAPHHTVSAAGLLGGGPRAWPGEITLAHRGVLFLDELPEFDRRCLEGLREPLERGEVSVARAAYRVRYPSRFLLVAAMNPCMCGSRGAPARECRCSPREVQKYRGRVSGPLLDRLDLQVTVPPVEAGALLEGPPGPSSASLRGRVAEARAIQARRGGLNAGLSLEELERVAPLDAEGAGFLRRAAERLRLSARAVVRVRRLARTAADLEGEDRVRRAHLAEAVGYRLREGG